MSGRYRKCVLEMLYFHFLPEIGGAEKVPLRSFVFVPCGGMLLIMDILFPLV